MSQPMFKITLQAARISCGYSVKEAAKLLHVNPDRLKRLEEDNSELSTSLVLKIGNLYGVSLDLIHIGPESECFSHNREIAALRMAHRKEAM